MPSLKHTAAYRIVLGAVHNAMDAHPSWRVPPAMPQSVAKRAAGTLLAVTPGALAALVPSREPLVDQEPRQRLWARRVAASARPTLRRVTVAIGNLAREARNNGEEVRLAALVDALRIIGRELKS